MLECFLSNAGDYPLQPWVSDFLRLSQLIMVNFMNIHTASISPCSLKNRDAPCVSRMSLFGVYDFRMLPLLILSV